METAAMSYSDDAVFAAFPDVLIDRDNIAHYRGLLARKLLLNQCSDCGYWIYPHRPLCPRCLSWDVVPREVSGQGRVFMYTLIHQERDRPGRLHEPTVAAAVELSEQPQLRYLTRIVNCPISSLALDMPVRLVWLLEDGQPSVAFEPATAA
jgi:uncharacterized OB-fold protein